MVRCADGRPFARKSVAYGTAPTAPDFDFADGRDGYREGVRQAAQGREVFFRADRASDLEVRPLPATTAPVIDAGFDEMVRQSELEELEKKWQAENDRIMRDHPPAPDPIPVAEPEPAPPAPKPKRTRKPKAGPAI